MTEKMLKRATNYRRIKEYLSGFAGDNELLEHYLHVALTDKLATMEPCLRAAVEQQAADGTDELTEGLLRGVMGEKYVFDPTLDPSLDMKVKAAADFLAAGINMQTSWGGEALDSDPLMLREEFLKMASLPVNITRGHQHSADIRLASVMDDVERQAKRLAKGIHKAARALPAEEQNEPELDKDIDIEPLVQLHQYEDGWEINRYADYDLFYKDHGAFSFCLGNSVSRQMLDAGVHLYCALVDPDKQIRAMIKLDNETSGMLMLTALKVSGGAIADNDIIDRVIPYLKKEGIRVPSTDGTGILQTDGELYNIFDLPDDLTEVKASISIENDQRPFTLNKIEKARNIKINHCKRFTSLGNLQSVGNLDLEGCKSLSFLGQLKKVRSSLDITNTDIKQIPSGFGYVGGYIHCDFGCYETILFCRRRFKKAYGRELKRLPGPE
jgi:hypothetical protein